MRKQMKVEQVIERLAVFGVTCLGRKKFNRRSILYRPLVFQFPRHQGIVYKYDKQWWIGGYQTLEASPYTHRREEVYDDIRLGADCVNLIEQNVSITIIKTVCDALVPNGVRLTARFETKDAELEQLAFLFCQGDVPGGVLLDRLREKASFVSFI